MLEFVNAHAVYCAAGLAYLFLAYTAGYCLLAKGVRRDKRLYGSYFGCVDYFAYTGSWCLSPIWVPFVLLGLVLFGWQR